MLYPVLTLFCIVVTGNHYWIDGVGGLLCLGAGYAAALVVSRVPASGSDDRGSPTVARSSSSPPGHA